MSWTAFGGPPAEDRLANDARQRGVGVNGLLAAAQDAGVAGLQAERSDVDGHVRAAFEYGRDNTERNSPAADAQPIRESPHVNHFADRVREQRDLADVVSDRFEALVAKEEAIEDGVGEAGGAAGVHVLAVGAEDVRLMLQEVASDAEKGLVLDGGREARERARGRAGGSALGSDFAYFDCHATCPAARVLVWRTAYLWRRCQRVFLRCPWLRLRLLRLSCYVPRSENSCLADGLLVASLPARLLKHLAVFVLAYLLSSLLDD